MSISIATPAAGSLQSGVIHVIGSSTQSVNGTPLSGQSFDVTFDLTGLTGTQVLTVLNSAGEQATVSVVCQSADGSTIPSATSIVDSIGQNWTVVSGVVKLNGANAGFTSQVALLLYFGGVVYQQNTPGNWWKWVSGAWVATVDPRASLSITTPDQVRGSFVTISGTTNQASVILSEGGTINYGTVTPDGSGNWSKQIQTSGAGVHTIVASAGGLTDSVNITVNAALPSKIFYGMNGHYAWGGSSVWNTTYTKPGQCAYLQDLGCTMYRADVAESTMTGVVVAGLSSGGAFYNKGIGFLLCLNGTSMGWTKSMTPAAAYTLGYNKAVSIGTAALGYIDYFEAGNELDQFIRSTTTPGNGSANNNWDQAGFLSCSGMLRGMKDGLKSVNPDCKVGLNIGIPMATAFVKMLWDGTDPNGNTGLPQFRGDYLNWHWYGSSGNIENAGGSLNIPQFIKDNFNIPWIMSEWGWASSIGSNQASCATYTSNTMTQYRNDANFRLKYNLACIMQYVLIDPTYGLIQADGVTKNTAYTTVKNFIAANPV